LGGKGRDSTKGEKKPGKRWSPRFIAERTRNGSEKKKKGAAERKVAEPLNSV